MSVLVSILAGVAAKVGAPIIKGLLEKAAPGAVSDIGGRVIDAIAGEAGVSADALPDLLEKEPESVERAVLAAEADMPEKIALWAKGLDGQFALLQAETSHGGLEAAWRWGWMYLLAAFWIWLIVLLPIINHFVAKPLSSVAEGVLMTLTTWFISLYMGGHTLKELGKNVQDAVRGWKS